MFEKFINPDFWTQVRNNPDYAPLVDMVKMQYDENKVNPIPVLTYNDYKAYERHGEREPYETPYFARRKYLVSSALLSLLYPENEEYFSALQDLLFAVCDEWAWATPAHTIGQEHKPEQTMIDLFSAETSLALTEIYILLKDRLEEPVKARVLENLRKRIVEPLDSRKYWWEYATNNWTIVCGGNVGITLMELFPDAFEKHGARFLQCAKQFIEAFPDDGTCLEGFSYWHYGFGNFVWFADAYYQYTNGKVDLFNDKKVEKIAGYASRSFMFGGASVSVADGVRTGRADATMLSYLSARYPGSVSPLPKALTHIWGGNVSWLQSTRAFYYWQPNLYNENYTLQNYDLPFSGQVIVHGDNYSLFTKAGDNGEPHNHNDVGSFILSDKNGQVLIDYGASRYTKESFSPNRYKIFTNSSRGHSLPIINGEEQKAGKCYSGTISHDKENKKITVEYANAYGIESIKEVTRVFTYGEKQVIINDTFKGDIQDIKERFITLIKPIVKENEIVLGDVIFRFEKDITPPTIHEEEVEMHGRMKTFASGCKACDTVYVIEFALRKRESATFTMLIR